jgi:Flp pilus assembly pilin Flp
MYGKLKKKLWAGIRDTGGATTIEYVFVVVLIGIAAIGGFSTFANEMDNLYGYVSQSSIDAQAGN